jgi:hypothetical protein
VVTYGVTPDPGKLEHLGNLGVEEVVFFLPSSEADAVMPVLDRYAQIVRPLRGG